MHTHKTLVITSFNQRLYRAYAHRFVDTFPRDSLELKIYSEDILDIKTQHLHLHSDFVERNSFRPVSSYKYDAVRFSYKVYAIAQAVEDYGYEYTRLLWIEADTVFLKEFDEDWITEHLYKETAIMGYAGRPNYYSEMGLILFNLQHPKTHSYINTVRNYYDTDNLYLLPEQHDSFVFDVVRKHFEEQGHEFNNWAQDTPKVPGGHILLYLFGDVMDHLKGKRKSLGRSPERKH